MKQKYVISREADPQRLVIKEYAELDKEMFFLLCEEQYPEESIRTAMAEGADALIAAFRTRNFYPTYAFATRIAEAIAALLKQDGGEPIEVVIDDAEFLNRRRNEPAPRPDTEEEAEDIDDLLDDAVEEEFEDIDIDKINSGLKIADDDPGDLDEDV
ncbi:MAG: hypothetical protein PHF66_01450 [Desulfobacteraceae bacterium]|nr:hypothetical protein [Desulfobacteraceae bacterium]MDD3990689.1 hypothetical protein [Desulfobacteraceae bacterium]